MCQERLLAKSGNTDMNGAHQDEQETGSNLKELQSVTKMSQLVGPGVNFHHDLFLRFPYVDREYKMPDFKAPMQ